MGASAVRSLDRNPRRSMLCRHRPSRQRLLRSRFVRIVVGSRCYRAPGARVYASGFLRAFPCALQLRGKRAVAITLLKTTTWKEKNQPRFPSPRKRVFGQSKGLGASCVTAVWLEDVKASQPSPLAWFSENQPIDLALVFDFFGPQSGSCGKPAPASTVFVHNRFFL